MAKIFAKGLQSILEANWTLRLETPMCIKSGATTAFKPTGLGNKTRLTQMGFDWHAPKGDAANTVELMDLHSGVRVTEEGVTAVYTIPETSLRGALRSWMLKRLVAKDNRRLLNEADEGDEGADRLANALSADGAERDPGLCLAADVFGVAAGEKESETVSLSHAGRLRVTVSPFSDSAPAPWVQGNEWAAGENRFGPENAPRHICVRGPLDRITQGAKAGGLHYFLEFSPGMTFDATLRIVNPQPVHLDLLALWRREIDAGTLRVGGLTAIGRGRLRVQNTRYDCFAVEGRQLPDLCGPPVDIDDADVFHGIWKRYPVSGAPEGFPALDALLTEPAAGKQEDLSCTT